MGLWLPYKAPQRLGRLRGVSLPVTFPGSLAGCVIDDTASPAERFRERCQPRRIALRLAPAVGSGLIKCGHPATGNDLPGIVHAKIARPGRIIIVGDVHGCLDEFKVRWHHLLSHALGLVLSEARTVLGYQLQVSYVRLSNSVLVRILPSDSCAISADSLVTSTCVDGSHPPGSCMLSLL